jgi:hypothetical protein
MIDLFCQVPSPPPSRICRCCFQVLALLIPALSQRVVGGRSLARSAWSTGDVQLRRSMTSPTGYTLHALSRLPSQKAMSMCIRFR